VVTFLLIAPKLAAQPQPEETKPDSAKTAGEVLEEALRKIDSGDFQEALVLMQRAKKAAPSLDKIKLVEGLLYAEAKRYAEAAANLEQYNRSAIGKIDWRGWAELGRLYKDSKLYQTAQRPLEQAKELAPEQASGKAVRAKISLDLADCLFKLNKKKKAMEAIDDAERLAPNDAEVQRLLADIALSIKDHARAARAIDKANDLLNAKARTSPFNSEPLEALRTCLELKIKIAKDRIKQDPNNAAAYLEQAEATYELGEVSKRLSTLRARSDALQGVAKDAKLYKLQVYLAFLEAELGGLQEALDRLNEVLANEPANAAAIKLREDIQARLNAPHRP